MKQNIYIQV